MKLFTVAVALCLAAGLAGWRLVEVWTEPPDTAGVPRAPNLFVRDSSAMGNHGIKQGTPTIGLPGHKGTSFSFGNPASWIQVPSNDSLNPQDGDFLISVWVNFTDEPKRDATFDLMRKGVAWTRGGVYKLEIISRGRVKCSAKDDDGTEASVIAADFDVVDGTWHQVACARAGATWNAIVDGVLVSHPSIELGSIANQQALSIGSKYGREDMPEGRLDEVRLVTTHHRPVAAPGGTTLARLRVLRTTPPSGLWHLDEHETPPAGA